MTRCLGCLEAKVTEITNEVTKLSSTPVDKCVICQREERLHEIKQELSEVTKESIILDLDDKDELLVKQATLESCLFDNSLKLPKSDVPVFSGNVINWKTFWEQFNVAIHSRSDISKPEKLVYL